jgi:hypothetical protein
LEVSEQYQIKLSNRFSALEDLHVFSMSRAWESTGYNIKTLSSDRLGYYDLKLIIP